MSAPFATKADARRWARRHRTAAAEPAASGVAQATAMAASGRLPREGCAIGIYAALPGEVSLEPLWRLAQSRRCFVALPRIAVGHAGEPRLEMYRVREGPVFAPLEPGPFGTRQPPESNEFLVLPEELSVLFVPGLLFDRAGRRLGRGGGFYDAYMARLSPSCLKIGVGFAGQLSERTWPCEPHDIGLDGLIIDGRVVEIVQPPPAEAAAPEVASGAPLGSNDDLDFPPGATPDPDLPPPEAPSEAPSPAARPDGEEALEEQEEEEETMARILKFTSGPDDWKRQLADPDKQWRAGYSARTLAHCWEATTGFPPEVAGPFALCDEPELAGLVPVLAVPEFKVPLPGGTRPSQSDLFVLARSAAGRPVSIMVEGKVSESFGPTLKEWSEKASEGKKRRLEFLVRTLGLDAEPDGSVRYQLLHRAASAIVTGEQYRAAAAVMVIHSFSPERAGWEDYKAFVRLFGRKAVVGTVQRLGGDDKLPLYGVWVVGHPKYLES